MRLCEFPSAEIEYRASNAPIKATGAQQSFIQDIDPVGAAVRDLQRAVLLRRRAVLLFPGVRKGVQVHRRIRAAVGRDLARHGKLPGFRDDDVPGFGLRVREGGSRTLIFQYKLGAKQRRIALGSVSGVEFADTRKTAEKLYARVKLGEDPAGDKAETKAKAAETFEAVAENFFAYEMETLRPRSCCARLA